MPRPIVRITQYALIAMFLVALFVVAIAQITTPDETMSMLERRPLEKRPGFTRAALADGSYFRSWETYLSDQVPWREQWVLYHSLFRVRLLGRQLINRMYLGSDGYLLVTPPPPPGSDMDDRIASAIARLGTLNRHVETYGGRFVYLHVPHKQMIHREHYPWYVQWPAEYDQVDADIIGGLSAAGVSAIDLRSEFLSDASSEELFYRTDHHWTFEGSYKGYSRLIEHFGLSPYPLDDLIVTTLPNPYEGSLNRRIGMALESSDRLTFATPKVPVEYTMTVTGGEPEPFIALPKDPDEPIDYDVFMGGDHAEILIDTHRPELPDALLVGPSFTNSIEPLLYLHFDQLRILDLRAYHEMSLYDYVDKHQPDCVMLLVSGHEILDDQDNSHFGDETSSEAASD